MYILKEIKELKRYFSILTASKEEKDCEIEIVFVKGKLGEWFYEYNGDRRYSNVELVEILKISNKLNGTQQRT